MQARVELSEPLIFPFRKFFLMYKSKIYHLYQESKGIRQWLINLITFLMMIHKITPSVVYNKWLKRLNTQQT